MPEHGSGLVLVGMPGSGKSTVGRLVAERLRRRFVDTDTLFERLHGVAVPAYLESHGERAFRSAEAAAVADACSLPGGVLAAAGGAVVDALNRWRLWHHGTVVWLDVPADELVRRLAADVVSRPTFEPYDASRLAVVLTEREPFYRAADRRVDGSRTPAEIAAEISAEIARRGPSPRGRRLFDAELERHHPIGPRTVRVVFGVELDLAQLAPTGVAIVDRRLPDAFVARIPTRARLAIAAGERAKRLRTLERVIAWMAERALERDEPVIAMGGGTVGDLAGTAAALYARGLPLVQVPTTWLAQADSAIGGKVAIDLASAKNIAGAFWPATAVLADVAALRTLAVALRRDGMAESVKAALIGDPILWELIESRGAAALRGDETARYAIIERSARVKIAVCSRDPFEAGERRTLNMGHTIGHPLEVASRYRLRHGAAVALGLRAAASIAAGRGAEADLPDRLASLLASLGFAPRHPFDVDAVCRAMATDKKRRHGRQRWILPTRIGEVTEVDDVTDDEVTRALGAIAA
jgi:shikimate kinase/3-dehydroquinate synthase